MREDMLAAVRLDVFMLAWCSGGWLRAFLGFQCKVAELGEEVELEGGEGLGRSWDPLAVASQRARQCAGLHPLARFCLCLVQRRMQLAALLDFSSTWKAR